MTENTHSEVIRLTSEDLANGNDDRFDRFRLIGWWDQEQLSQAKVLVVGAGALGNEILKNLAMLGIGNVLIADLDRIENSNLSRSILYREENNGEQKAKVAAEATRQIYPQMSTHYFDGNVVYDLGLGVYRWADIVMGGLDNREARLSINRNCWKLGRPWFDGAIEQIQGCARVFVPDGPCYECTMSETDWRLLQKRRSCNLLSRNEMELGKIPTTPTISSIIAGVQCQEAVKFLHQLPTIAGKGWVFNGESSDSYLIEYQRKDDCLSHDSLDEVISLDEGVREITAGQLLSRVQKEMGQVCSVELARDVLEAFECPKCGKRETVFSSLGKIHADNAYCPECPDVEREVKTFYTIDKSQSFLELTLAELGIPPFDIVVARTAERVVGFEMSGDARQVLGPLAGDEDSVDWN